MAGLFNGTWIKKGDSSITVVVDKTFKKGYVTGFQYQKFGDTPVHSQFKATYEELEREYERV